MSTTGEHGISRIDTGRTHGFQVRLTYQKDSVSKFFADLKNGGRDMAFRLAIAYRNVARRELCPDYRKRKQWIDAVERRNT